MIGGQITFDGITKAELEALYDMQKNKEGVFHIRNLQVRNMSNRLHPPSSEHYQKSPWNRSPSDGVARRGSDTPIGAFPPPRPSIQSSSELFSYKVTLIWDHNEGLRAIGAAVQLMAIS